MNKKEVLETIEKAKIVPVIRSDSAQKAESQTEAVFAGGVKVFEITLTVPDAPHLIEKLSARYGDQILLGAGTILNKDQAEDCIKAGAKFIVSPIFRSEIVEYCQAQGIAVFPAGLTPNEIYAAYESCADGVKIFPANSMGGAGYLKSLKAVFPDIKMMPTGGVSLETINDFLDAGAFAVGIGGELTKGTTDEITSRARHFLSLVQR